MHLLEGTYIPPKRHHNDPAATPRAVSIKYRNCIPHHEHDQLDNTPETLHTILLHPIALKGSHP